MNLSICNKKSLSSLASHSGEGDLKATWGKHGSNGTFDNAAGYQPCSLSKRPRSASSLPLGFGQQLANPRRPNTAPQRTITTNSNLIYPSEVLEFLRTLFTQASNSGMTSPNTFVDVALAANWGIIIAHTPTRNKIVAVISGIRNRPSLLSQIWSWQALIDYLSNHSIRFAEPERTAYASLVESKYAALPPIDRRDSEEHPVTVHLASSQQLSSPTYSSPQLQPLLPMIPVSQPGSANKFSPMHHFASLQRELEVVRQAISPAAMLSSVSERLEARMEATVNSVLDEPWDTTMPLEEEKEDHTEALMAARFVPLTDAEAARVTDITLGPEGSAVLIEKFSIDMTRSKLRCLRPRVWLNDEIVNYYIGGMLIERDEKLCAKYPNRKKSHAFNSFFMDKLVHDSQRYNYASVKRWSRKFDVFSLEKVFVPINIANSHWTLAVVYVQRKEICYYDSMNGAGRIYLVALRQWLLDESKDKKGGAEKGFHFDESEWKLISVDTTPQQLNGHDCGVFTIFAADFIMDDLPVAESSYGQRDMAFIRTKIVNDILRGSLDYPLVTVNDS